MRTKQVTDTNLTNETFFDARHRHAPTKLANTKLTNGTFFDAWHGDTPPLPLPPLLSHTQN